MVITRRMTVKRTSRKQKNKVKYLTNCVAEQIALYKVCGIVTFKWSHYGVHIGIMNSLLTLQIKSIHFSRGIIMTSL